MTQDILDPVTTQNTSRWMRHFQQRICPFWQNSVTQGEFNGEGGVTIAYYFVIHPQAKGSVMISSGRIEAALKYQELVYELFQQGYSVFIHDHRGQGLSGRMNSDKHRGYVEDFDHYVADMYKFYQDVVKQHSESKPMLVCHSMGSAVGALFQLKYPDVFERVVYSAPMFGIKSPLPQTMAKSLVNLYLQINQKFSSQPWYFIGQGQYSAVPFPLNLLTHSKSRYQWFRDLYQSHPELQLGGVTGHWLSEAVKAMEAVYNHSDALTLPTLLLQAGNDMVVDNKAQYKVAERMPNCEVFTIPSARHEIFQESDPFRTPAMEKLFHFLSQA